MQKIDDTDLIRMKAHYEAGSLSKTEVAKSFNITIEWLSKLARKHGWIYASANKHIEKNAVQAVQLGQTIFDPNAQSGPLSNIYKSAKSKAIKDAVKNWGVALFLDDDDSQSSDPSNSSPSSNPYMTTGDPVMPTVVNAPTENVSIPTPTPASVSAPNLTVVPNITPPNNVPTSNTSTPAVATNVPPANTPSANNLPSVPPAETSSMPTPTNVAINTGGAPTGLPSMGVSTLNGNSSDGDTKLTKITNVQEVAIQSKLDHKSLDFASTVKEMFESTGRDASIAPTTLKDLSYQDALGMVNFVTNK